MVLQIIWDSSADQLRAMKRSTAVTTIGMQLEYFPSASVITARTGSLGPFISLEVNSVTITPKPIPQNL
jgi:hypothetical protein